jgi:hypothetical protein
MLLGVDSPCVRRRWGILNSSGTDWETLKAEVRERRNDWLNPGHGVELHSLIGASVTHNDFGYIANIIYRQIKGHPDCGRETCVQKINHSPGVVVTVSSSVPLAERNHFLALNTACFARVGGCKNARDLLPVPEIR